MNLNTPIILHWGLAAAELQGSQEWAKQPTVEGAVMIANLIDALFGCRHSRYSFPVTLRGAGRRPQAAGLTGTYVACLDCGREFPYDWQEMKVITSQAERREYVASLATRHAA